MNLEIMRKLKIWENEFKAILAEKYPISNYPQVNKAFEKLNDTVTYFNTSLKTTGGRANYRANTIELNQRLIETGDDALRQTFGHELAHLFEFYCLGSSGHGYLWQKIMANLGLKVERCHSHDWNSFAIFKCLCTTHKLKKTISVKIMQGSKYSCRQCKGHLTYEKLA